MKNLLLPCFFLLLLVTSCKKNVPTQTDHVFVSNDIKNMVNYLEKTTGFDQSKISYDNSKKLFTIDKDILIEELEVKEYISQDKKQSKSSKISHYRGTYLLNNDVVSRIYYEVKPYTGVPGVDNSWKDAVTQAFRNWNNTNSKVKFIMYYGQKGAWPNLRFYSNNNGNNDIVASAYLPASSGMIGGGVQINTYYNFMSFDEKVFAITHELGHTLGLLHTDQVEGSFINGTPVTDPNSVMNSFVLPWAGFTNGDLTAINILYPN
jgi:hypothetical protein